FVKDLDDTQAQIERIVENFQRRDPSFMEQGEAVAALMQLTDRDVSEVANRLGQSVSWVRRRAKLPNLISAWREELAKDDTPYSAIRNSVNKLEEVAVLPPATQRVLLDSKVLRYLKTTKAMRNIIAKHFLNLDAKPWTRTWEKKTFSGSGKMRWDACMKRSDRENALFADPDDPNTGKKMCLDPECWPAKCRAWGPSRNTDTPGRGPGRQGYRFGGDTLDEDFSVTPLRYHQYDERDEEDAEREGYTAAIGVIVDGAEIGTTRNIWLSVPEEDEDDNLAEVRGWRSDSTSKYQQRRELAELISADITAYLEDIDTNATATTAQLADRKIRAAVWFGLGGYANSEEEDPRLDDPEWNPLAWAWAETIEYIAEHVAMVSAEAIARLYDKDEETNADRTAAALVAMFEIPLDVITTRAPEALYNAPCREEADHTENDPDPDDKDGAAPDMLPAVVDMDELTDPADSISVANDPYLQVLAIAQ
ncbi:MAG: hypothetical protein LUC93_01050, partial [Planctomycetaceae bacterium]|nr:hypothetical protein [Planctomycetaceae bacterium]